MSDHDVELIRQLLLDWERAIKAGDLGSYMDLYDDDAIEMWPGHAPFIGKEAIRAWYADFFSHREYVEAAYSIREVEVAGRWAFDWGISRVRWRSKDSGEPVEASGKCIEVLRKQPDGSWKFWRTILNSNPLPSDEA